MSEENKTSPITAFAPPYTLTHEEAPHILEEDQELKFPAMTMDDWADCCAVLKRNRRLEAEKKLVNPMISQGEREFILSKVDADVIPMSFAFNYRTQTPQGIGATLRKQLTKQLISEGMTKVEAEAKASSVVKLMHPMMQQRIALYVASPPEHRATKPSNDKGEGEGKNEESASMSETGTSMPQSSESSGPEQTLEA